MNKNIKGITIVLDGDATKLSKAMQSVVSESVKLHKELKEVERALKFEPGNAELVAQKQEILRKNIELTKQRLDTLRQAHKQVEQQFKNNEISAEQFRAFRREVVLTESSLKTLKQKLGDIDGDSGVDRLKRKFNELGQSAKDAGQNIKDSIGNLSFAQTIASVVSLGAAVKTALDEDMLDTQIDIAFNVDDAGKQVVREAIGDIQAYGVEGQEALEGVRRQFALNADAADEANAKIVKSAAAMTKIYGGLDFTELIQEVNEVASELEIADEEALELMNDLLSIGFPPEEIDIIAEYGQQLKRAGFEAEEIKNIMASATMTGSWNIDSLLDGLKEGRIRAAEMGNGLKKSMQDALRSALNTTKAATEEQLKIMQESFSKQEDAKKKSLEKQEKALEKSLDKQRTALEKQHDKAYSAAQKLYEKKEKELEKSLDNEYKKISSSYEKKERELQKSLDKEYKALSKSYDKKQQALEKSLDKELREFEKASDEKIRLIDKEYTEKLKLVDEEKYRQIKAIENQIDGINAQTEAEEKAQEERENARRIAELRERILSAETAKERAEARQDLADFEESLRQKKIKEERQLKIEELREQKEQIQESFEAKKEAIEEEMDLKKEQVEESISLDKEALQEKQKAQKDAFQEEKANALEALKERQTITLDNFKEEKEQALSAIKEKNKAELDAFKQLNSDKLKTLQEQQKAESDALDERLNAQIEKVKEAHNQELESFKKMNERKLELAKNPPDSKAYLDMEAKLVSWGKAIAKGGKEGSQAFIDMAEWLNSLEDATLKNTIGVELFGTKWEDEGDNIIQTILGVNDAQANLAKNAKDLTDSVSKLDETPMVKLKNAVQDLVIALQPLLTILADVISMLAGFTSEHPKLAAASMVAVGALTALSLAFTALKPAFSIMSIGFKLCISAIGSAKVGIDKFKDTIGRLGASVKVVLNPLAKIKNTFTAMNTPIKGTETSAKKLDVTEKQLITTTNKLKQSFDKLNATLKNLQGAIKGTTNDFKRLNTTMNAGKGTAAGMNQSATKLNNTTTKLNNNKKKLNTTMSGTNKILGSLSGSFTKAGTAAGNAGTKTSKLTSIFSKFSSLLSNVGKLLPIIARGFLSFSGPVGAAITAITSLISHFDLFKKIDLKKIGKAIIDGFLNGLKSAWNGVKSWIKDKANDVSKTFKDVLGIRSPSRVFASHGQDTMKGYQVGLESMKSTVIKDVTQTATSITSNFKNALSKSKLKDAIPRLSVDTIQKTTVEYRNSMQNNTQQSTYTNGLLESLLYKMSKINGGDGNHTATINLYLDGDIIGKANVDYINRRSKIEGRSVLKNLTF